MPMKNYNLQRQIWDYLFVNADQYLEKFYQIIENTVPAKFTFVGKKIFLNYKSKFRGNFIFNNLTSRLNNSWCFCLFVCLCLGTLQLLFVYQSTVSFWLDQNRE